jgi:hypothetical protein
MAKTNDTATAVSAVSGGTGQVSHQELVRRMLEGKVVDFEAAGKMLAEMGPRIAMFGDPNEPWENFCLTMRTFFHTYRLSPGSGVFVEDLAKLRDAAGRLGK